FWSEKFGDDNSAQVGRSIVAAPNGDAIVMCELSGAINFGGKNLTGSGRDVAVARLGAATGAHVWSIRSNNASDQYASSVAVDPKTGDVYLVGTFVGTLTLDPAGGSPTLTSAGQEDIYLARLDPMDGHVVWGERFGNIASDFGRGVAVDGMGAVY